MFPKLPVSTRTMMQATDLGKLNQVATLSRFGLNRAFNRGVFSEIMAEDDQYEQNPEGGGGNGEKIDCNYACHMIL